MAITLKDVEGRYSDLVLDIIENIERVLENLKNEKVDAKKIYQTDVQQVYNDQKKLVENKRSEMRVLASANKYKFPRNVVSEIVKLRLVLRNLIHEEIEIERGDAMTFQGHQKRIDNEIKIMDSLLNYIENNVIKTGRKALVGKKMFKVDHPLNITAMYEQIKKVYDSVRSVEIERNVIRNHRKLKEKIKKQAEAVIKRIDAAMKEVGGAQEERGRLAGNISSIADAKAKEAESILQRELNAFMREYNIVKEMDDILKSGQSVKQKRKQLRKLLTRLQRVERMELRARVNKLEKAANKMLEENPSIDPMVRKEIKDAIATLKVFEAQIVVDTVKALGPKIKKMETEADVAEVKEETAKVERATQAATVVGQKAKRAIDAVKRGTEMRKKLIEEGKKTVGRVKPKRIENK